MEAKEFTLNFMTAKTYTTIPRERADQCACAGIYSVHIAGERVKRKTNINTLRLDGRDRGNGSE